MPWPLVSVPCVDGYSWHLSSSWHLRVARALSVTLTRVKRVASICSCDRDRTNIGGNIHDADAFLTVSTIFLVHLNFVNNRWCLHPVYKKNEHPYCVYHQNYTSVQPARGRSSVLFQQSRYEVVMLVPQQSGTQIVVPSGVNKKTFMWAGSKGIWCSSHSTSNWISLTNSPFSTHVRLMLIECKHAVCDWQGLQAGSATQQTFLYKLPQT